LFQFGYSLRDALHAGENGAAKYSAYKDGYLRNKCDIDDPGRDGKFGLHALGIAGERPVRALTYPAPPKKESLLLFRLQ
jgi:hypothetical protein